MQSPVDLAAAEAAGRSCPLHYRYGPEALAGIEAFHADTLWVVGGLYGNLEALDALEAAVETESGDVSVLFNGDFHWFDAEPGWFAAIDERVAAWRAIRGNVETELAGEDAENGCGCAYPAWVDDGVVERSNRIMATLGAVARRMPARVDALAALPMMAAAEVGRTRVGIVHGDLHSLAGWQLTPEGLGAAEAMASLGEDMRTARVDMVASTHTCVSLFRRLEQGVLINNGAAGMPNFADVRGGVATRIAVTPPPQTLQVLYGTEYRGTHVHAIALPYDDDAWQARFLELWPPGSAAYESYFDRIRNGTSLRHADVAAG